MHSYTKMKIDNHTDKVVLLEGVSASLTGRILIVKGQKGEVQKRFIDPRIGLAVEGNSVIFKIIKYTKKEKTLLGTYKAHVKNMCKGVTDGHEYTMKICSGHFPMNVSINNNRIEVKNFLGEKVPRALDLSSEVELKIEGEQIIITGIDKETVAQTAGKIEQLTKRSNFDRRVFQDGIYIVNKDGKQIA